MAFHHLLTKILFQCNPGIGWIVILDKLPQLLEVLHLDKPVILDEIAEPKAQEQVGDFKPDRLRAFLGQDGTFLDNELVIFFEFFEMTGNDRISHVLLDFCGRIPTVGDVRQYGKIITVLLSELLNEQCFALIQERGI